MNVRSTQFSPSPSDDDALDSYEGYAARYDPAYEDGRYRRQKKKANHKQKRSQEEIIETLTDESEGLEAGFAMTYRPARFEAIWLYSSLSGFYDRALITDVLSRVKGGKEANVYRCAAHPSVGAPLVAAKVYRPRKFRNLRNDKRYREGRSLIDSDGKTLNERDTRLKRAVEKGGSFGSELAHTSWLMHEYATLERLHAAGGAVPRPMASGENALLMQFQGNAEQAAPTLHEIELAPAEAEPLFLEVMRNVELMLGLGIIHGDLSAYNILYWEGKITLIDFPQVVDVARNPHAREILFRDVARVCDYFRRQGVACNSESLADNLWHRYTLNRTPMEVLADLSRLEETDAEEE
ncbi:MAG: hypothetical protein KDD92_04720 [Caldilineaceae bacterium]|nr:hypothetical protein [Caldilineaceae bacterium]